LTFNERFNNLLQVVENPLNHLPNFGGHMGRKNHRGVVDVLKHGWIVLVAAGTIGLYGCGSSEEATTSQSGGEQKTEPAKPMDQALTSFTSEKDTAAPETKPEPAKVEAPPSQLALYEKQIADLQTENTSLKQKIVKLEQDNRTLNARVTETEAKLIAEKERADKAEDAAKNVMAQPSPPKGKIVESTSPTSVTPAAYDQALIAFRGKKYDTALQSFQSLLDGGIREDLADNCTYWIGETYFAKRKYSDALKSFEAVMKYKASDKKGDAQYMLGQTYERQGNKAKAKEAYERVVKDYPMNSNVKRAKEKWAKL
jgi:tol-pal system protein YbgF